MIPLHLTLRNFMSYGDAPTEIDLRGMSVVCLSGDNGHGKSAILDAITWSLWGETRLGRQNHEQLIRLGADEMSVVLDFQEGDDFYRVRRQRSRRAGAQLWELQAQEAGGAWRPLSGQSSGDTGRAIVQILRMNYETFLNSAFLRQGRADEFVRQTANKRKEILAEILDLSRYDDLEDRARARMKDAQSRRIDAERSISQIESQIGDEERIAAELAAAQTALAEVGLRIAKVDEQIDRLTDLRAALDAGRRQIETARQSVKAIDASIVRLRGNIEAEKAVVADADSLIAQRARIEADYRRSEEAQADLARLQADAQRFREIDRRRADLLRDIKTQRQLLERQATDADTQMESLRHSLRELAPLRMRLAELQRAQTAHVELAARRAALAEAHTVLTTQLADLTSEYRTCERDREAAQDRRSAVMRQEAVCEICGSPLPPSKLAQLAKQCDTEINRLSEALADLKKEGSARRAEKNRTEVEMKSVQADIDKLDAQRQELGAVERQVRDLDALERDRLPEALAAQTALHRQLGAESYADDARKELAASEPEWQSLRESERHCEQLAAELQSLRKASAEQARLQTAQRERDAALARSADAERSIHDLTVQRAQHAEAIAQASAIDTQLSQNARELADARAEQARSRQEQQRMQRDEARLQHQIETMRNLRGTLAQHKLDMQSARNDEDLYAMLAGAFGKRGVQALIIENALPELEADANELLERITDGELAITIRTTRQARSRSTADAPIETLEIGIRDHLGDRPLEMYSGGESFRVAFALRIALSKLLTRRAGAHLQTLIIDEGFGTQDAKGREKLVDAIMAIQGEFAQILVITHVDELKDAFPNRIEVIKTPAGSELTLIGGAALG